MLDFLSADYWSSTTAQNPNVAWLVHFYDGDSGYWSKSSSGPHVRAVRCGIPPDIDCDSILDGDDNCLTYPNPLQEDYEEDGLGDVCDECTDTDEDGYGNPGFPNICIADNCPDTPNPDQEDTYPPNGNGIGDACDCEGNFDCDQDVDAIDVDAFLTDFGRSIFVNPCTNASPCNGDFLCDGDVDADDVDKFLEDFGRNQFVNPCPACVAGDWCLYP